MEVACGEHGEHVPKLVTAVANGKCNNLYQTGHSAQQSVQPGSGANACDCGEYRLETPKAQAARGHSS